MHYSRLLLNPRSSQARRDLADNHEMHRTVMSAFPELQLSDSSELRRRTESNSGSILWRVDHDRRRGIVMLIVQSESPPDWGPLLQRYPGYVSSPPESELPPVSTMERDLSFVASQRLSFRLRANPTRKVRSEGRRNGQRLGLTTSDEQLAWLQRKANDERNPAGFQLVKLVLVPDPAPRRRPMPIGVNDEGGTTTATRQLTHVSALFEGILQVTDPEQFQRTLRSGIGGAKAFGFGLLSVARV